MIITRDKFFTASGDLGTFVGTEKRFYISLPKAFNATFQLKSEYNQAIDALQTAIELKKFYPDFPNEDMDKIGSHSIDSLSSKDPDIINEMILMCQRVIGRLEDCQKDLMDIAKCNYESGKNERIHLTQVSPTRTITKLYIEKYAYRLGDESQISQDVLAQVFTYAEHRRQNTLKI